MVYFSLLTQYFGALNRRGLDHQCDRKTALLLKVILSVRLSVQHRQTYAKNQQRKQQSDSQKRMKFSNTVVLSAGKYFAGRTDCRRERCK